MRQITNLDLVNAGIQVLLFVVLYVFLYPLDHPRKVLLFVSLLLAVGILYTALNAIAGRKLPGDNSIWKQPVSARTGNLLVNAVSVLLLSTLGLLTAILVFTTVLYSNRGMLVVPVAALLGCSVTVGLGRIVQVRLSIPHLLPYAVSSIIGLLIMFLVLVTGVIFSPGP